MKKILIWLLLLSACDTITLKPSTIALLSNGSTKKWYTEKVFLNGQEQNQSCERDDILTFEFVRPTQTQDDANARRGGYLSIDPAFLKCDSQDAVQVWTWFLGKNEQNVYIESSGFINVYEIIYLDEKRLKFRYTQEYRYGEKLDVYEYELYSK